MTPFHTWSIQLRDDPLWRTVFREIYQLNSLLFIAHFVKKNIQFPVCLVPWRGRNKYYIDYNVAYRNLKILS